MDHIDKLRSFVPFGKASYSDIVTELQEGVGSAIPTKALEKAKEICATGKGLLILTGNAGHGKTFIAREILLHFQGKVPTLFSELRHKEFGFFSFKYAKD